MIIVIFYLKNSKLDGTEECLIIILVEQSQWYVARSNYYIARKRKWISVFNISLNTVLEHSLDCFKIYEAFNSDGDQILIYRDRAPLRTHGDLNNSKGKNKRLGTVVLPSYNEFLNPTHGHWEHKQSWKAIC